MQTASAPADAASHRQGGGAVVAFMASATSVASVTEGWFGRNAFGLQVSNAELSTALGLRKHGLHLVRPVVCVTGLTSCSSGTPGQRPLPGIWGESEALPSFTVSGPGAP